MIITSLRSPIDVVKKVHEYGGVVFHDVISIRHAEKALEAGVDGLVLVCAGAGGHAGMLSPFALVREVRRFFDGPIALSGAITDGAGVLAAEAIGADFAYIGTRFIATREANAVEGYKQMILDSTAAEIVYAVLQRCARQLPQAQRGGGGTRSRQSSDRRQDDDELASRPASQGMGKDIWGAGRGWGISG
jgi:nitronate monooxygenase